MDQTRKQPPGDGSTDQETTERASRTGPVIVGIGASAGALSALEQFFSVIPADSGLAFVVIQHLDRHHPSVLAELLGKHTLMPVQQAEDQVRVQPNHVYVIPPNSVLTLERALLGVEQFAEAQSRTPIDTFFRSLGRVQGERAIAVVLSGAGSDGTAGLRIIKEHGGLAIAQSPETAQYDSMPASAIAAGLVDFVLSVDEMPDRILAHANRIAEVERQSGLDLDEQVGAQLGVISDILHRHTGHDFSQYKTGTLVRRIRRRVQLQQSGTISDYVQFLDSDPVEVGQLHRDLLIGVTLFFRDPETFALLAAQVIAPIVNRSVGTPVRIWVPGCASGEEAYSLAMLVREHQQSNATRSVQIFATDIDSELLAKARLGRYPERIADHVSPERLERFFIRDGSIYQVSKELREMCTFSEHSLIRDPPFSSLDLISCRNLLIYLGLDLQKKLVPLFHYALRAGGFLLLGPSESLAAHSGLFTTLDKKHRLFRRNDAVVRPPLEFPLAGRTMPRQAPPPIEEAQESVIAQLFSQAFERMILEEYAPPSAVTNENGDLLYLAGRAGRYLQVAAGMPTNNLFDLAQGILRVEIRNALTKAATNRRKVVRPQIAFELDGVVEQLRLTVRPLPGVQADSGLYAVVLQRLGAATELEGDEEVIAELDQSVIEQLENELRTTRASLQSAMRDTESANEELKSANEELISTNEELQSANEELQTSKEELQAANDELNTKVLDLDTANSDLQYHFAGTRIITVFLDRELRILRCTPAASMLFNVLPSDLGRPFSDLAPRFVEEDVMPDIARVLQTEAAIERQVHRTSDSSWFLLRVLPYRAQDGAVAGVGVTFVDISDLKRAEEAERLYGRLLFLSPDAVWVWRLDGGIETWNRGAEALYGFSLEEARGKDPRELLRVSYPCSWTEIGSALREMGHWEGEGESRDKEGRLLTISAKLALMRDEDGIERILQSDRDITDLKAAGVEREREGVIQALQEADRRKSEFLAMLSHELRNPLAPVRNSLYILDHAPPGGEQALKAKAVIERQFGHLTRIVEDLLEVTRLSYGKLQLRRVPVELGELVRRAIEDHGAMIADAGLALEVQACEQPLWVNGDPTRLAQALGNLLSNACKFTPRGGRVLVVLDEDAAQGEAVLRVRDTGAGIDPETLGRLFTPFAQADGTLDRGKGGLGLGLALVKGMVEQHGGEVHASSQGLGRGAEFIIRLPLIAAPSAAPTKGADSRPGDGHRVLVIEDNVDAAYSLGVAMELAGHEVAVAYDGPSGLEKALEFRPDVVLCDIGLPGIDGYEVARRMRTDENLRSTYLVALSGYALPDDLDKARDAGFDEHMSKPPSIDRLVELLAALGT